MKQSKISKKFRRKPSRYTSETTNGERIGEMSVGTIAWKITAIRVVGIIVDEGEEECAARRFFVDYWITGTWMVSLFIDCSCRIYVYGVMHGGEAGDSIE